MNYLSFLSAADQWVNQDPAIHGAAITNYSFQRQEKIAATLLLVVDQPLRFLSDIAWLQHFTVNHTHQSEAVGGLKLVFVDMNEIEVTFAFVSRSWAGIPVGHETALMIQEGFTLLKDNSGQLKQLVTAVNQEDIVLIRDYLEQDLPALARIHQKSIHTIDASYYLSDQNHCRAPVTDEQTLQVWRQQFLKTPPYVAEYHHQPVGFMELTDGGIVTAIYVAEEQRGKHIGSLLIEKAERLVKERGLNQLRAQVSAQSRVFFERNGFSITKESQIQILDSYFTLFCMKKCLTKQHLRT